jgi:hypothetical protein
MTLTKWLENGWLRRHLTSREEIAGVTDQDADELIGFVREFKEEVISWLKKNHPGLA